jgi:hypothetical protein
VSSLVAGSFWPESRVSVASDRWSSSLLQGQRERERKKRRRIGGTISVSCFCKKLCSRAVFALSDYVFNP